MTTTAQDIAAAMAADLASKLQALAQRQSALREEVQRAQTAEGLTRARLAQALLAARRETAKAQIRVRQAAAAAYRAAGAARLALRPPPLVNRRHDGSLARLGVLGGALVIARSGLWTADSGGWAAMQAYVRRGPDPLAHPWALFDQAWYLQNQPDVPVRRMAPLVHYITNGGREGRSPHPLFDPAFYTACNSEALAATELSPLEHFVHFGAPHGQDPHPLFSVDYYVAQVPELTESGENPLMHYLREGRRRGLSPHPLFQPDFYRSQQGAEDLQAPDLVHYLTVGSAMGLKPHRLFDPAWYRTQYPDTLAAGGEPLCRVPDDPALRAL